jgi:hypothetical protein
MASARLTVTVFTSGIKIIVTILRAGWPSTKFAGTFGRAATF